MALEDEYLRLLLHKDVVQSICVLRKNATVWYNISEPIRTKAQKALIALADENASLKDLIYSLQDCCRTVWLRKKGLLETCLLYDYINAKSN